MPTKVDELFLKNKNRAKRDLSSAGFTIQTNLPGGQTLPTGTHVLGRIEPNVAIMRVALVVKRGFGANTEVTILDSLGNLLIGGQDVSAETAVESDLTKNAATRPNPIYSPGTYELTYSMASAGTDGELEVIVEYTQLDTVTGKYTR